MTNKQLYTHYSNFVYKEIAALTNELVLEICCYGKIMRCFLRLEMAPLVSAQF